MLLVVTKQNQNSHNLFSFKKYFIKIYICITLVNIRNIYVKIPGYVDLSTLSIQST